MTLASTAIQLTSGLLTEGIDHLVRLGKQVSCDFELNQMLSALKADLLFNPKRSLMIPFQ